tara:strand:- start:239 stop:1513 length:1275 start_codon:yes stop_codon:yes gene_type:complete
MNFTFNFRLDKRRKLNNGNYTIKVNLHSKLDGRNYDFKIKPAFTQTGARIDFECSEDDWNKIWIEKDKINSLGEVIGEMTVHGNKFEIRTLLKIKQDILNDIISRDDLTSHKEIKEAFNSFRTRSKDWDNVYSSLQALYDYHVGLESYAYADGFKTTINNFKTYNNYEPLKFTEITVSWLKEFEQKRRVEVGPRGVAKDLVNLRTAYNKAKLQNEVLKLKYPFGVQVGGYSMPQSDVKNAALTLEELKKLRNYKSDNWYLQTARDFFLFSFYLRGANLTDIARLKKSDTSYVRKKTKKTSGVEIKVREFTPEMLEIIKRHKGAGKLVFNIIEVGDSELQIHKKVRAKTKLITDQCKNLARVLDFNEKFSLQWARHTVGFTLANNGIPMKAIQENFGHKTMRTTEGYIKSMFNENEKDIDDALEI